MLQHVLNTYAMNLKRAGMQVQDLSAEQMVQQPSGVINHPAWTLGHLAATADNLAKALGLESTFPDAWRDACKTGGTPSGNAADFPAKEQLLETAHRPARAGGGGNSRGRRRAAGAAPTLIPGRARCSPPSATTPWP